MSKNDTTRVMDSPGRPVLPPQAEAEILDRLFTDTRISSGEIAAILKKHGVQRFPAFTATVCKRSINVLFSINLMGRNHTKSGKQQA